MAELQSVESHRNDARAGNPVADGRETDPLADYRWPGISRSEAASRTNNGPPKVYAPSEWGTLVELAGDTLSVAEKLSNPALALYSDLFSKDESNISKLFPGAKGGKVDYVTSLPTDDASKRYYRGDLMDGLGAFDTHFTCTDTLSPGGGLLKREMNYQYDPIFGNNRGKDLVIAGPDGATVKMDQVVYYEAQWDAAHRQYQEAYVNSTGMTLYRTLSVDGNQWKVTKLGPNAAFPLA